jgi:hypothetical protein
MSEPAAAARSVDTTRGASVNQLFNYYKIKKWMKQEDNK